MFRYMCRWSTYEREKGLRYLSPFVSNWLYPNIKLAHYQILTVRPPLEYYSLFGHTQCGLGYIRNRTHLKNKDKKTRILKLFPTSIYA